MAGLICWKFTRNAEKEEKVEGRSGIALMVAQVSLQRGTIKALCGCGSETQIEIKEIIKTAKNLSNPGILEFSCGHCGEPFFCIIKIKGILFEMVAPVIISVYAMRSKKKPCSDKPKD